MRVRTVANNDLRKNTRIIDLKKVQNTCKVLRQFLFCKKAKGSKLSYLSVAKIIKQFERFIATSNEIDSLRLFECLQRKIVLNCVPYFAFFLG